MPRALLANNIATTLFAAITSTAATTFTVTSAAGMPAPTATDYFYCTLLDSANVPEIVKVTNVTGTTLTCVRAQDGTAARTFLVTATVKINLTAAVMNEIGADGGGSDAVFYENDQTVNTSYTITTGRNAMTTGPISIATGATVTVPTGSVWMVL